MKIILSVLIGMLVSVPSFAATGKGCGINSINMSGFQNKDDNEYLYENVTVYNEVPDKNGTHSDLSARVWECDNEYCPNWTEVELPAGHYFMGIRQSKTFYRCRNDEWHPFACGEGYISFDGVQGAADNEFLYSDKTAYEEARRVSASGQDGADIQGKVYECDNAHCLGRSTITMPANHYFKGQLVDHAVEYRCYVGAEDRWEPIVVETNNADTCGETYISFDGVQSVADDEFLYSNESAYNKSLNEYRLGRDGADNLGGLVYECDNDHCTNGTIKDMGPGHVFKGETIKETRRYMCKSNFGGADRWVLMTNLDNGGATPPPVDNTCREKRATDTGKACCDIPANMARYDALNDKCICNGNNDFVIENGRGVCKPRGDVTTITCPEGSSEAYITQESCIGNGTFECTKLANNGMQCLCGKCVPNNDGVQKPYDCDADILAQINKWAEECDDENKYSEILALIARIREYCTDGRRTEAGFMQLYSQLVALNPDKCAQNTLVFVGAATAQIEDAVSTLDVALSDLDVSKWKTADGKFNTARLASDTIAGVVLGTAGGLITSHVVKKHQIEEGFEDIKCVIGGQGVAGWGDEFNVGVQ